MTVLCSTVSFSHSLCSHFSSHTSPQNKKKLYFTTLPCSEHESRPLTWCLHGSDVIPKNWHHQSPKPCIRVTSRTHTHRLPIFWVYGSSTRYRGINGSGSVGDDVEKQRKTTEDMNRDACVPYVRDKMSLAWAFFILELLVERKSKNEFFAERPSCNNCTQSQESSLRAHILSADHVKW